MSASQAMPCPSESKKPKRSRFPPGFKRAAGQKPARPPCRHRKRCLGQKLRKKGGGRSRAPPGVSRRRPMPLGTLFDRHVDEVAPLRPRAVVVLDRLVAQ